MSAAQTILSNVPAVYGLSFALTADPIAAEKVTEIVVTTAADRPDVWANDPARWFDRFTVQTTRRWTMPGSGRPVGWFSDPALDGLLDVLWSLPVQQREAFILHQARGAELRRVATAMDCSSNAAATHLAAATEKLRTADEDRFDEFVAGVPMAVRVATPPPPDYSGLVVRRLRRRKLPWKLLRTAVVVAVLLWVIGWLMTHHISIQW